MTELYIGLMSGTSVDGIDAALVDFSTQPPQVVGTHYAPYTPAMQEQIHALCRVGDNEIERLGELDTQLGKAFAAAAKQLLTEQSITPTAIKAIGSHGQTVRHSPKPPHRFSLQIGDPNIIAAETGITTVADFRRKDMAHGGQGAPLVPAFHQFILASDETNRAVVNIGGIANVTLLQQGERVIGFDTGPGNTLLDAWMLKHQNKTHDKNGDWGSKGRVNANLLNRLLADQYFQLSSPKSTGREHFNLAWLEQNIAALNENITPIDVQATLTDVTAKSIIDAIRSSISSGEILICGGGAHNAYLMQRMTELAQPHFSVASTQHYGIDPDWMEAIAFAWLAKRTLEGKPGNLPSVTGATQAVILGGIYY